ncbi:hypothetical protein BAUCODRAFT_63453 [Baudoinia panamericana UAMH 10762]|uniref:Uncharacterized protein n=1 Tax=Baudoinia panamericana (strain UAMH 10762) TaxID=717646 RepID=M2LYL7_BAUPA|nr:uncharacterized protein BAUCODRAFT_63453 [Baudoinia panamericana UAMH 10762]EMC99802.1 hypothetical protein BAUCODRAFT_63453 [Baudoinia panamericana UAMH 10762]
MKSKFKWGKVFKENETPPQSASTEPFKLNEDVVDFLKPSTEKSMRPKIDIAIAQRWPAANEAKVLDKEGTSLPEWTGYRKPRRREGLAVAFVKTAPEVVGEGGDDALEPPTEVGRQKAVMPRSVSARQPAPLDDNMPWPGTVAQRPTTEAAKAPTSPEEAVRPPPVRRAGTSHFEMSAPMERKHASPSLPHILPHKPSLGRTPTGFLGHMQETAHEDSDDETYEAHSWNIPMIDTQLNGSPSGYSSSDPSTAGIERSTKLSAAPKSPVIQRRQDMEAGEGMVLRRASSMEIKSEDDGESGQAEPVVQATGLSTTSATSKPVRTIFSPGDSLSPDSALSPLGPSPFADPIYMKRRSRDGSPASVSSQGQTPANQYILPPSQASRVRALPQSDRTFDAQSVPEKPHPLFNQPSHSSGSANRFPGSSRAGPNSQPSSRDDAFPSPRGRSEGSAETLPRSQYSPHKRELPASEVQASSANRPSPVSRQSPHGRSPPNALLSPAQPTPSALSPGAHISASNDYFAAPPKPQPARSPAATLRQADTPRPGSSDSARSSNRPIPSSQPPVNNDHAANAALADFAGRVAHMNGVFRLTAEKERPADQCTPQVWLRAGLWWYLKGKAGLESLLQQRQQEPNLHRDLLIQAHVDLAKAWWILSDHLQPFDTLESQPGARLPQGAEQQLQQSVALLRSHIKSLSASMIRSQLMPPAQSLIQGQNTTIWLQYPRFNADAATVLGSYVTNTMMQGGPSPAISALEVLPLGDDRTTFCYGRFPVDLSLHTDDANTDRVAVPCMLTMLRDKQDLQPSIVISSQSALVNLRLGPRHGPERGPSWRDVSWRSGSHSIGISLPRGFEVTVRMQERDLRTLWNLVEYARKVQQSLAAEANEKLVHEVSLAELQYADSAGSRAFPQEKLSSCSAFVFERTAEHGDGRWLRKKHDGFRLLLMTDPSHKSLSSVSHKIGRGLPMFLEFVTDAAAQGTTAMVIRIQEDKRQCRLLLVFPDSASRQALFDVLNGISISSDEVIVAKMALTGLNIQPASSSDVQSPIAHPALHSVQWQELGVTNCQPDDPSPRAPSTTGSESLRIVAKHAAGCLTDRLNLGKGELLLRLPCADTALPAVQILRNAQEDLAMSIDSRHVSQGVASGMTELLAMAQKEMTIRTFTFATLTDLHAFQASITGCTVRYDGIASTFGISQRMMVVPIYQKKQASGVRLQVVVHSTVAQVLVFMEDFALAEALCFQVKSTDTFERIKGDSRNKKWAIKFVDAKFKLPQKWDRGGLPREEAVRQRFVNLEGLEYAEEHDDITVGFDTEEERDVFARALPAATTVSRGITLKRRI